MLTITPDVPKLPVARKLSLAILKNHLVGWYPVALAADTVTRNVPGKMGAGFEKHTRTVAVYQERCRTTRTTASPFFAEYNQTA